MGIKVKRYSTAKALKKSLKRNASSGAFLQGVGEDGMVVRFLMEPEEWLEYQEFFNEATNRSEIVTEDWVKPAGAKRNPSKRFGVCVLNRETGEVVGLRMASTLAQNLLLYYEKYGTIMDRDYELIREGKGMDTKYNAIPEAPERIRGIEKYEVLDIMEILETMASDGEEEDDDDEDDEDVRPSRRKIGSVGKKAKRRIEEDDEDDYDDEDEDEEEDERPRRKSKKSRKVSRRRDDDDEDEDEDDDDEEPVFMKKSYGRQKSTRQKTMRARKSKRR